MDIISLTLFSYDFDDYVIIILSDSLLRGGKDMRLPRGIGRIYMGGFPQQSCARPMVSLILCSHKTWLTLCRVRVNQFLEREKGERKGRSER